MNLDENLLEEAKETTGITEGTALIHAGLRALVEREAARRMAMPAAATIDARKQHPTPLAIDIPHHVLAVLRPRLNEIIRGRRRITAATALRPGEYFGVPPRFRLGLQNDYDPEEEQEQLAGSLQKIPTISASS